MKLKLGWKYCECGCHGHEVTIGGLYFWELMTFGYNGKQTDYNDVTYELRSGHGRYGGVQLIKTKNYKEISSLQLKLLKQELVNMKKSIVDLEEILSNDSSKGEGI